MKDYELLSKNFPPTKTLEIGSIHKCTSLSFCIAPANKPQWDLPYFYSEALPTGRDKIVHMEADEFWDRKKVMG